MTATSLTAAPSPRWPLLEIARWVAIYAIVWLHTVQSDMFLRTTVLTRFAVPLFVAASVFLVFQSVRHKPGRTFLEYGRQRFIRIYVPFLVWSAIYLGFKALKSASMPEMENRYPSGLAILWTGGFYHLWFMPFILGVSLAAFAVAKAVHSHAWVRWPATLAMLAGGAAIGVTRGTPGVSPLGYMVDALPAALWGATLALVFDADRPFWRNLSRFHIDAVAFLACLAYLWMYNRSIFVENVAGIAALLMSLHMPRSSLLWRLGTIPSLAYGIYLSHLLPIKIFGAIAKRQGFSVGWKLDLAIFFTSAIAATLLTWLLYRFRWTRWLVT